VKSFNWQDTAAARQLNNQNYNICFRTELVAGAVRNLFIFSEKFIIYICISTRYKISKRATQMCVSPCTGTLGNAFFLTGQLINTAATPPVTANTGPLTGTARNTCSYDFLAIAGGFDPVTGAFFDRYCGSELKFASVCSMFYLFTLFFFFIF
jgi:hypothetical protein